jgi:acyl phosphate:glycerol-3-phosphate acyltransferase
MRFVGLAVAFLLGSTPFAYFAGRLLKGIDLRELGSGNLGATNVYRNLGAPAAIVVFLLDVAKGAIPVLFFATWFRAPVASPWWPIAYGVAAILGHVKPYAGLFRGGGKGVATSAGVFAALAPGPFLVALAVFSVVVYFTRYMSLGSMTSAVVLALLTLATRGVRAPVSWAGCAVAAFVLWTHRSNIGRLRRGEESRLGRAGTA